MANDLIETLLESISTKNPVRVRYFGGSSPGMERDIIPTRLFKEKVKAVCLITDKEKMFFLKKMELVVHGESSVLSEIYPIKPPEPIFENLNDFYEGRKAEWESMGWIPILEENQLLLYRKAKRGNKILKNASMFIRFEEMTSDIVFDGEKMVEQNIRKRIRPWTVTGHTFGLFSKAQEKFVELVRELGPV
ncbi:MAG: hypothetical protein HQK72_11260 [Desulfamplus sp.]|nr:hypothetical protein [Desulfamplus sp.]